MLLTSSMPVFAKAEANDYTSTNRVVEIEGPSVYVDFGEYDSTTLSVAPDGSVSGEITPLSGKTEVTLKLTGYINDIENYFSEELYGLPLYVPAGSTTSGYFPVGYIIIDPNIDSARVETDNFMCFFNNEDVWIRLNEISGKIILNDF